MKLAVPLAKDNVKGLLADPMDGLDCSDPVCCKTCKAGPCGEVFKFYH